MQTRTRPKRICLAVVTLLASVVWVLAPVAGRANCCCVRAAAFHVSADATPSCCHGGAACESTLPAEPVDSPSHDCHCHFETCGSTPRPAVLPPLSLSLELGDLVGSTFSFPATTSVSLAELDAPETFLLAQQHCARLCRWLK